MLQKCRLAVYENSFHKLTTRFDCRLVLK